MKREIIDKLSFVEVQKAHAAYSTLAVLYESVLGGPNAAKQYKEYFAIMDSREMLRLRALMFIEAERESDGKQ